MTQLCAYLSYNGNCTEAMNFYAQLFGAKLETLLTAMADENASEIYGAFVRKLPSDEAQAIVETARLFGKKVAVPFVSTGHYSLLAALKHWNIDPSKVTILNLAPPAIIAAWKRGHGHM